MLPFEDRLSLDEILAEAWRVRRENFPDEITFSAPSGKRYDTAFYQNEAHAFPTASVTGHQCSLRCDHCGGKILESMEETLTPGALLEMGEQIRARGGNGLLLSGGSNRDGEVPLERFGPAIVRLKEMGLRVLVHTGLISRPTARVLKESGVDQVLVDVLGDAETIHQVYHLDKTPEDYLKSLIILKEEGLVTAPHVVIGLHYGRLKGEYRALEIIREAGADHLVLVVLNPLPGTKMAGLKPLPAEEVARLAASARLDSPKLPISLGCARPPGPEKETLEKFMVEAGVNAIAYPMPKTVEYSRKLGLKDTFHQQCCTL